MKKIMFVCHGNICRSPMAEFIFKNLIDERDLGSEYFVSSSATSTEEIYNGVGNPELLKHGISCGNKKAVQLTKDDYNKYDLFVCMDSFNVKNALRIFGADNGNKIKKLMDFTESGGDVADPWYTGNFGVTYKDILEGCKALMEFLEK